jgi:type-F conjugative transfer system secretin TraK
MRNLAKHVVGIICLFSATYCSALQIKAVKDNQTVMVKVSSNEPSRIFVAEDRISKVHGIEGAYDINKDENNGEIFIQPTPPYQHKVINLFISTEFGHSYTILLSPMDIPAENIELKPLSPAMKQADHWEKNAPYVQTLINLMNAMVDDEEPEGYAVVEQGASKSKKLPSGLTMRLLTIYQGNHLQGEIWEIKNESRNIMHLHPREFVQENTLSSSIEDEVLNCGDETFLYRVMSHG